MKRTLYFFGKFSLLALLLFMVVPGFSQQAALFSNGSSGAVTVSGTQIINSYYPVTSISGNQITVSGGLSPAAGDKIMLIQMTGANAGQWEWAIVSAGGSPFTISNGNSRSNINYTTGRVQVVTVPQYTSLTVPSGATLTGAPWNGTTGGILTFMVQDIFNIQAGGTCDVSGLGYTGGAANTGGSGGSGGSGGDSAMIGVQGGYTGYVTGSAIDSGGYGGWAGYPGGAGGVPAIVSCPDCSSTLGGGGSNTSALSGGVLYTSLLMGGGGQGNNTGNGGIGAGGGGGGGGAGTTKRPGQNGGAGGSGGGSGAGGAGGGILIFSASSLVMPASGYSFVSRGLAGSDGGNGQNGGIGGDGGRGSGSCNSGGGGRGAGGGNGGGGAGAGAGGTIYALLHRHAANFNATTVNVSGGASSNGGQGGTGGQGGINPGPFGLGCFDTISYVAIVAIDSGSGGPGLGPDSLVVVSPPGPNGSPGSAGGGGGGGAFGSSDADCDSSSISITGENQVAGDNCGVNYNQNQIGISGSASTNSSQYEISVSTNSSSGCQGSAYYQGYTISVTDGNGCQIDLPGSMTYYDDNFDLIQVSQTNASCPNTSDGSYTGKVADNPGVQGECNPIWNLTVSGPNGYSYFNSGNGNVNGGSNIALTGLARGVYLYTIKGSGRCSQPTTGSFTINSNYTSSAGYQSYDTICSGSSISWHGRNYTQSGNYTDTLHGASAHGCDSIVYMSLTVLSPITAAESGREEEGGVCSYGTFNFDARALGISGGSGTYSILPRQTRTGCGSSPFSLSPSQIIFYTVYVTDSKGCTLNFPFGVFYQVNAVDISNTSSTNTSCPRSADGSLSFSLYGIPGDDCGYNWNYTITGPNGYTNTNSGSTLPTITLSGLDTGRYNLSLTYGGLCQGNADATFTIHSNNTPVQGDHTYDTICPGTSLSWHGRTYTQSGSYADTLRSAAMYGCDSIVYLTLTINYTPISGNQYDTICYNRAYVWRGTSYRQSGVYADTLHGGSVHGCDSVAILNLTVRPPVSVSFFDTVISGTTLAVGSHIYTRSGAYVDTLINIYGCDSIIHTFLYVDTPTTYASLYDSICQGSSYRVGIHSYSTSGTSIDTLINHWSGDSIVTLHLLVYPITSIIVYDTLLSGTTLYIGNHIYSQTGIYTDTLISIHGCDSIIHSHLYIDTPRTYTTLYDSICQGWFYRVGIHSYSTSGTHIDTLVNHWSGDSIVTLHLFVYTNPSVRIHDSTICIGNSIILGGYPTATGGIGPYTYTWYTSGVLNAVNNSNPKTSPDTTTIYSVTVTDAKACSATASQTVTVNPLPKPTITPTPTRICMGSSTLLTAAGGTGFQWSNAANTDTTTVSPTTTTTYTVTVTDSTSCSATATDTVIVNPVPTLSVGPDTSICVRLSYIIPGQSSASSVIWSPDSNLSDAGIVAPTLFFSDSAILTYMVIAYDSASGCADTVHLNITAGHCRSYIDAAQAFSPNNDQVNDFSTLFSYLIVSYEIRIYNRFGELVYTSSDLSALNDLSKGWDGTYQGKPQPLDTYMYYIIATDAFGKQISKKGNITLLR